MFRQTFRLVQKIGTSTSMTCSCICEFSARLFFEVKDTDPFKQERHILNDILKEFTKST